MIRYHKTQINEQEADLIPSLHFIHLHQTLSHLKLGHHGSMKRCTMQGIDVSIVCVYIFILYSVFRLGREERPSLAWSVRAGWWRQLRPRPLCWAQVRPRLWPVEWSAWPAVCQSVLDRHRVQSSRAQSSRYSSQWSSGAQCHQVTHGPPCHMWVWSPIRGHSHCCCDCLANDCFNKMNISWQCSYSNMHILGVRFKCHVSLNACECDAVPKISKSLQDFIAPPQCGRASNLILLKHVSQQPVFKI